MSDISIVYLTSRPEPKFEWFVDSLYRQSKDKDIDIQLIFIDIRLWYEGKERKNKLEKIIDGRFSYIHVPPKDSIWQGPNRIAKRDFFAAANARNTGCMYANAPFLIYADDVSVLSPNWLEQIAHAKEHGYVVGGAYRKVFELVVEKGEIKSWTTKEPDIGVDSRWHMGEDGIVRIGGGQLFGCSFGLPMDAYLACNGQDEICDSGGAEDYDLGIRLMRAGYKIFYNRNMFTIESEELHAQKPIMIRVIAKDPDKAQDSSQILLRRVVSEDRITTISNYYNLREEREKVLAGGNPSLILEPRHYWYNGTPIEEM